MIMYFANGDTKTINMPKKKKIKHLIILEDIDDEILSADNIMTIRGTDLKIKRFLKLKGIVKEG